MDRLINEDMSEVRRMLEAAFRGQLGEGGEAEADEGSEAEAAFRGQLGEGSEAEAGEMQRDVPNQWPWFRSVDPDEAPWTQGVAGENQGEAGEGAAGGFPQPPRLPTSGSDMEQF